MTRANKTSLNQRRRLLGIWLVVVILLSIAALAAYVWMVWGRPRTTVPEYIYATVQRGDFEDLVSATGSLQPRDYVDVGAQVSGQLRKLHVEVGADVAEGQLLAEIDAEQSVARVDASRASLRAQQAQLTQSRANLKKAERDLLRLQNLWKAKATTLELVENAETVVETTRAQIEMQEAQIEQLQASMRVDESNLKYTKIYAPMAGTVVSITAKQGQTLNTNQSAPTLLRIADLSVMTVQTQVSEADISKLRTGMPAYFTTLGSQSRRWHGQLNRIEPTPTVTNNVVLYNAMFDVENSNRNLMAQMTAQVFFVVAEARGALVVPMAAMTFQRASQPRREESPEVASNGTALAASGAEGTGTSTRERRWNAGGQRPGNGQAWAAERNDTEAEPTDDAADQGTERPRRAGPRIARGPKQEQVAGGEPNPVTERRATVKVADGDNVVERDVVVGVSSRVQAQILSGLNEGERVVVGIKQPEAKRAAFTPSAGAGANMPPGAGMGPGPGGMGR